MLPRRLCAIQGCLRAPSEGATTTSSHPATIGVAYDLLPTSTRLLLSRLGLVQCLPLASQRVKKKNGGFGGGMWVAQLTEHNLVLINWIRRCVFAFLVLQIPIYDFLG